MAKTMTGTQELITHYLIAKEWIYNSPYRAELRWQESQSLSDLNESHFLREYAWVVLNSGFREFVVRKHFDFISLCFCDWESAASITTRAAICVQAALSAFQNRKKLDAVAHTASMINRDGFEYYFYQLQQNPTQTLQQFPFIGNVTSWHLAKNLGADVAKPDRHLMRLAQRFGYNDVAQMCSDVSRAVGDRISVTDLILWRFEERSYALSVRRDPGGPPMALSVAPAAIHPNAMFLRGLQASVRVVANGVRASSASRRPTNRVLGAREEKASV